MGCSALSDNREIIHHSPVICNPSSVAEHSCKKLTYGPSVRAARAYLCQLHNWIICVYDMFWHSSRAQSASQDQICRSFEGIIYAHSLRELYSFQFSLAEVEFLEQYGNENVEAKWMGKYDERCGKKLSKESPLYKTFLEDKYERKCWLDDAFKLFPKLFDALKRHCFNVFRENADESGKQRKKHDSSSNSGTIR
jgi:hypothetical protein